MSIGRGRSKLVYPRTVGKRVYQDHMLYSNVYMHFFLFEIFVTKIALSADENAVSSDDELSGVEVDVQEGQARGEDRELKDRLLRKFGSHISSLKLEFSKKKKKGKLPKEARQALMEWWNVHYKWPYPTVSTFLHSLIT